MFFYYKSKFTWHICILRSSIYHMSKKSFSSPNLAKKCYPPSWNHPLVSEHGISCPEHWSVWGLHTPSNNLLCLDRLSIGNHPTHVHAPSKWPLFVSNTYGTSTKHALKTFHGGKNSNPCLKYHFWIFIVVDALSFSK